ncbi:hypothetical protein [Sulfuracidifex tepidarius]|uniref:Uncharacterized protein n=1 Tax=Sulfuracidifex tepidarius TaxID=1294262 RepID=A0A510DS71_9CREN|nr:hypothetical protein [Sulfuracidifex tepidarius]BBG23004.1 hypothetical protein IC006_0288 [Sulfuracidifex tepidarius]BBG25766.1 hypothetical protein IC007_0271 [Sulfuracidifex tepidarius]
MESRRFAWNVGAGIIYALLLTIVITVFDLIAKLFYPPFPILISPLLIVFSYPVLALVELVVLGLMLLFAYPITVKSLNSELGQVRYLSIFGIIGYLIFSLLPYAVHTPYIQTFIGLIIVSILFNGLFSGSLATLMFSKKEESQSKTNLNLRRN